MVAARKSSGTTRELRDESDVAYAEFCNVLIENTRLRRSFPRSRPTRILYSPIVSSMPYFRLLLVVVSDSYATTLIINNYFVEMSPFCNVLFLPFKKKRYARAPKFVLGLSVPRSPLTPSLSFWGRPVDYTNLGIKLSRFYLSFHVARAIRNCASHSYS